MSGFYLFFILLLLCSGCCCVVFLFLVSGWVCRRACSVVEGYYGVLAALCCEGFAPLSAFVPAGLCSLFVFAIK